MDGVGGFSVCSPVSRRSPHVELSGLSSMSALWVGDQDLPPGPPHPPGGTCFCCSHPLTLSDFLSGFYPLDPRPAGATGGQQSLTALACESCRLPVGLTAGVWAASIFGPCLAGSAGRPLCFTSHLPQPPPGPVCTPRTPIWCPHSAHFVVLPSPPHHERAGPRMSTPSLPLSPPTAIPEVSSPRGVPACVPGL